MKSGGDMERLDLETKIRSFSCQYLPEYIIDEIRLRLPAKSLARFRCVSKAWFSIGTDLSFLRAHCHRASKSLLVKKELKGPNVFCTLTVLFTAADGFSLVCNTAIKSTLSLPEEFRSTYFELLASCDGLVFLHSFGIYWVFNPLTGQCTKLPLPQFHFERLTKGFGFYFHRWTGEYRLLSIVSSPMRFSYRSEVLSLGEKSWRRLKVSPPVKHVIVRHSPICVDDFLCWVGYQASLAEQPVILVFDIRAELFTVMPSPPYQEEWEVMVHEKVWLIGMGLVDIESRLGFYTVDIDKNCKDDLRIDVWLVDDYKTKRWTKFYSVGCEQGWCLLGQVNDWWKCSIAIHIKDGDLLLLFDSYKSFLVRCCIKSGRYRADHVFTDMSLYYTTLIYRESLISCDLFCDKYETQLSDLGPACLEPTDGLRGSNQAFDPKSSVWKKVRKQVFGFFKRIFLQRKFLDGTVQTGILFPRRDFGRS